MARGLWTVGGINLPDFGISEALGLDRVGVPNNSAVYSQEYKKKTTSSPVTFNSDGTTSLKPGSTMTDYNNWLPTSTPAPTQTQQPQQQQQNTGGSSGGGVGTDYNATRQAMLDGKINWDDGLLARLNQNASNSNQSTLDAINKKLQLNREYAGQQRQSAETSRNSIKDYLAKRFPELQRIIEEKRANALGELDTQQQGLTTIYDKANAQARRRAESTALQNRMTARAGNRLGSSFYDELVASNNENLGRTLGESDQERISKIAAIGTQRTQTNQEFNNMNKDIEDQKTQAEMKADEDYRNAISAADYLDRAGIADYGESVDRANAEYQSKLDSIGQWAQSMAQNALQISGQYGSNLAPTLNNILRGNSAFLAGNAQTPGAQAAGAYSGTTMNLPQNLGMNRYANQGIDKKTLEDILNRFGLSSPTA